VWSDPNTHDDDDSEREELMEPSVRAAVVAFFDEFVDAFETFDGSVIARRYRAPCVVVHADGSFDGFATDGRILCIAT